MALEYDVVVVWSGLRNPSPLLESIFDAQGWKGFASGVHRLRLLINEDCTFGHSFEESIEIRENAGWVRAANAGLSLATAPYVVLMNDDTEVRTEGWLEKMSAVFAMNPKIAAVGPRTDTNSPQGRLDPNDPPHLVDVKVTPHKPWPFEAPLSFFCVMFRQEALREIGLLDLRFAECTYGDDDDWQMRAHQAGWMMAVCPEVLVHHEGSATLGPQKAELQVQGREILQRKWGR